MKTLGLRHVALNVKDAQISKKFYTEFFSMELSWEPDVKNVYLTSSGRDNLALHEKSDLRLDRHQQALDHIGFMMASREAVDAFYDKAKQLNVPIVHERKLHRDGAYSFYIKDPDENVIQIICLPFP